MLARFFAARGAYAAVVLLASTSVSHAMSVIAPTFDQLVAAADVVVRGVVTDVRCINVDTPQGVAIQTVVTLRVERGLKGNSGAEVTLHLLGGKMGARTLTVLGMPQFQVGQREIVFMGKDGQTICPVLAGGHGRYHVRHDASEDRDYVVRDNDAPLTSTDDIAQPLEQNTPRVSALRRPMTPDEFEARIAAAVGHTPTPVQP